MPPTNAPAAPEAPLQGDPLEARVAAAVLRAGGAYTSDGRTLLPAGSMLDRVWMDAGNAAHIDLTLPAGSQFDALPESHAAALDEALRAALCDRPPAGLHVRLRIGAEDYRSLATCVFSSPAVREWEDAAPASPVTHSGEGQGDSVQPPEVRPIGGPVSHADGQPAGALSGVVVFCNAGHGWTAGASSWSLQRPVLHAMNEDYGNLDQLNYLVHYLYNAGAVVVPFRPVGYQPTEIVLDNDDTGVRFTGNWINSTDGTKYYENGRTLSGIQYRYAMAAATATASVRYTPSIPQAGFYPVYCWTPTPDETGRDRVTQVYRIIHSGGTALVPVDHRRVGRGWIWLGTYHFEAGAAGGVEITNQSPDAGVVVADAIRFGNGMGDIRDSVPDDGVLQPGRVSGYPRDEEAARYWAHSELGLRAVGFDSTIWDVSGLSDGDDNVGTAARWAREMNRIGVNNDRWRRLFIEYHSNASNGAAKGTIALYNTGTGGTANQLALATRLGEKVEADLLALDDTFEYGWGPRSPNTYHASFPYGAISAANNGDEFDATILEVAFHDNVEDAANLRNARVRDAIARSTCQGIISFLSDSGLFPGTRVPAVYPPDTPERLSAACGVDGRVTVNWTPGPSRPTFPAGGDLPTGYRVYRSPNGYGFGNPVAVGNATSATLDVAPGATLYLRVAATNAGGESMPSSVLAVRRPAAGRPAVLIVDGFDRVSRFQNPTQTLPAGPIERTQPRRVNSFDYAVQHARAIAAAGQAFDCCQNEAITAGTVKLADYSAVIWILGEESTGDRTLDTSEQALITQYLSSGGGLFVSGADLAYDLDDQGAGRTFMRTMLGAAYQGNSANTSAVTGSGGIMADVDAFDFDVAQGAPYLVESPDRLSPQPGGTAILRYVGGTGDAAAVQFATDRHRAVVFGFPFECITSDAARADVMSRVLAFLILPPHCRPLADFDCDGDVDMADFGHLQACLSGPGVHQTDPACEDARLDGDGDVDADDYRLFARCLTGENVTAQPDCMAF